MRLFKVREPIWAQNFGSGPKWIKWKILSPLGNIMFQTSWSTWSWHKDQIRDQCEDDNIWDIPSLVVPGEPFTVAKHSSLLRLFPQSNVRVSSNLSDVSNPLQSCLPKLRYKF